MPDYKGNFGNLMQHWTLCEILRIANNHARGLNYIDAHAMAPWLPSAQRKALPSKNFSTACGRVYRARRL